MKRFLFLLSVVVITQLQVYSQGWEWAVHLGYNSELNNERVTNMVTDGTNYYAIGAYWGTLNTPGGVMYSNGINDIFIIKYDAAGNQLWARSIGSDYRQPDALEGAHGVYDPINNCIYIAGTIVGSVVFDAGVSISGSSVNKGDAFVAKMDLDGHFSWAKSITSLGEFESTFCFAEPDGDVLLMGNLRKTGSIDGVQVPPGGFFARFDTEGHLKWIEKKFDGPQYYYRSVAFIGTDMIIGGYFDNTASIDTAHLASNGSFDGYLTRTDSLGHVKWIKTFGNKYVDGIGGIATDRHNNIYITGTFKDSINLSGTILKNSDTDFLLCKLDENGNMIWAKQALIQGNTNDYVSQTLFCDENGSTYTAGGFGGTASFGKYTVKTNNQSDMFIVRYNSNGDCMGVRNFGPADASSLVVDKTNNIVCSGSFPSTITIGNSTFISYGGNDIFIAKSGVITGIHQKNQPVVNQLVIYAKPNTGKCTVTIPNEFLKEEKLELRIYNSYGMLIQQQDVMMREGRLLVNLQSEARGVYLARLSNGKKEYTGKIIFE